MFVEWNDCALASVERQRETYHSARGDTRTKLTHCSWEYKRPTGTWSSVVRKMAYLPVRVANSGNSAADTMFWCSFRILPDRLKLIRLYSCGSLGPSISFIFGTRAGHFAATPQSDVVRICDMILASWRRFRYDRKCLFFCIYNLQITISPTSSFSASFNWNNNQKSLQTLDLSINFLFFLFIFKLCSRACEVCVYISSYCPDQHEAILTLNWLSIKDEEFSITNRTQKYFKNSNQGSSK